MAVAVEAATATIVTEQMQPTAVASGVHVKQPAAAAAEQPAAIEAEQPTIAEADQPAAAEAEQPAAEASG